MKKTFLIIALFLIAMSAQAQMYTFSHQRMTAMKNNKVVKSVEALSRDTLFLDGENIQMVIAGEFVSQKIQKTELFQGYVRYSIPNMTLDVPTVASPESVTLTLAPDEKKVSYKIIYYVENIIR